MTWVKVSDADMALHKKFVEETVVARWAERCGKECAAEWNDTVGKIVGMTAPVK
jgi:TRAP-type transport system periplasmic protein